jgi:hypothetical protein
MIEKIVRIGGNAAGLPSPDITRLVGIIQEFGIDQKDPNRVERGEPVSVPAVLGKNGIRPEQSNQSENAAN